MVVLRATKNQARLWWQLQAESTSLWIVTLTSWGKSATSRGLLSTASPPRAQPYADRYRENRDLDNWNNLKKSRVVARRWGFHSRKPKKNKKTLHVSGHAQPPLPDHASDSLRPKVFLIFFGFLDWNLHLPASTLGFFNLFWFGRP